MAQEYYSETEDGFFKDNTYASSKGLRFLALLTIVLHGIVGLLIIGLALVSLFTNGGNDQLFGSFDELTWCLVGGLILFSGYVWYVVISAVATVVENSDRSDVVDAIHELTGTIRDSSRYIEEKKYKKEVRDKAVETIQKKVDELNKEEDDVELPELDISDI